MLEICTLFVWGHLEFLGGSFRPVDAEPFCLAASYQGEASLLAEPGSNLFESRSASIRFGLAVPLQLQLCAVAAPSSTTTEQSLVPAGDLFAVPEGSVAELLEYIEQLRRLKPQEPIDSDRFAQFQRQKAEALLKAAEKVLTQKPKEAQWTEAAQTKLEALGLLALSGDPDAKKQLDGYVRNLQTLRKRELARYGRAVLLAVHVPKTNTSQEIKKWFKEFVQFLSQGPLGPREWELMDTLSQRIERENPAVAVEIYRQLVLAAAKTRDPLAASVAKKWEEKGRRLELLTKPIQIVGFTLDGREFQWDRFRQGKIVLVDFWATWCGWCVREIPELMEVYQKYRDRGLEIVGVSADGNRKELEEFLGKTPIPWPIVYGRNGPSPTLEYYGIQAFPTMWLVGKDGKVISFNARGENLRRELERLFGAAGPANLSVDQPLPPGKRQ